MPRKIKRENVSEADLVVKVKKPKKTKVPRDLRSVFRFHLKTLEIEKLKKPWMVTKAFAIKDTEELLQAWVDEVLADKTRWFEIAGTLCPVIALDTETIGLDTRLFFKLDVDGQPIYEVMTDLAGICLSSNGIEGIYIPLGHEFADQNGTPARNISREAVRRILQPLFDVCHLIFYNAKFDREIMRLCLGVKLRGYPYFEDVQVLQYIVDPKADVGDERRGQYTGDTGGLKALSKKLLGLEMIDLDQLIKVKADWFNAEAGKNTQRVQYCPFTWVPLNIALYYAASDAICTWLLWFTLKDRALQQKLVHRIDQELVDSLTWIERQRFLIDVARRERTVHWHTETVNKIANQLREIANKNGWKVETAEDGTVIEDTVFNPGSNPQVGKLLFKLMNIKSFKKTGAGGDSVDAEAVAGLLEQNPNNEFLKTYVKYKEYVALHPENLEFDKRDNSARIYLKQNVVAGGRLSGAGGKFEVDGGFGLNPQGIVRVEGNWWVKGNVLEPDTIPEDQIEEYPLCALHPSCMKDGKIAPNIIKNHIGFYQGYAICLVPSCTTCDAKFNILWRKGRMDANEVVNIRTLFYARTGWTFFTIDYSNIEMRAAANVSGEPEFIKEFLEGKGDFHSLTASKVFPEFNDPKTDKAVKKALRALAKIINFALLYGGTAYTIFDNMRKQNPDITWEEANGMVERYWGGVPGFAEWCLDPNTKVLTSNLSWKILKDVNIGDELIGFDENRGKRGQQRKLKPSMVTGLRWLEKPCVRITTNKTSVICSVDHQWLARRRGKSQTYHWRKLTSEGNPRYGAVRVGDCIPRLCDTWEENPSHEAGYLQGIFDGEGCASGELKFTQKEGVVLNKAVGLLQDMKFNVGLYPDPTGTVVTINGGLGEQLRCLGTLRPMRLIQDAKAKLWPGISCPNRYFTPDEVTSIEYLGVRPVISIETSTKTLVAEGLLSHNCNMKQKIARDQMICKTSTGRVINFQSGMEALHIHKPSDIELENYWAWLKSCKKEKALRAQAEGDRERMEDTGALTQADLLREHNDRMWRNTDTGIRNVQDFNRFMGKIGRIAVNVPLQGLAGDFMRISLNKIRIWACNNEPVVQSVLRLHCSVHDEIDFAVKNEYVPFVLPRISRLMKLRTMHEKMKWPVPIECDVEYGRSWDVEYHVTGDDGHKPAAWTAITDMENYIPSEFAPETVTALIKAIGSGIEAKIEKAKKWFKEALHARAYDAAQDLFNGKEKSNKEVTQLVTAALQLHEFWTVDNTPDSQELETLEAFESRNGLSPQNRGIMPPTGFLGHVDPSRTTYPEVMKLGLVTVVDLTPELGAMLDHMQKPGQQEAMQAAFEATPEELGKAAVEYANRIKDSGGTSPSTTVTSKAQAPSKKEPVPELLDSFSAEMAANFTKALGTGSNKIVYKYKGTLAVLNGVAATSIPKEFLKTPVEVCDGKQSRESGNNSPTGQETETII